MVVWKVKYGNDDGPTFSSLIPKTHHSLYPHYKAHASLSPANQYQKDRFPWRENQHNDDLHCILVSAFLP